MQFTKYHGSGNDFILIDNRHQQWEEFIKTFIPQPVISRLLPKNNKQYSIENKAIFELCHRNFGIGADGLMLLQNCNSADFKMIYYNSDGHLSTMCGNGGRCIAHFAANLTIGTSVNKEKKLTFTAPDGLHYASIDEENNWVELSMNPVHEIHQSIHYPEAFVLNTGSPHFVEFIDYQEHKVATSNQNTDSFIAWAKTVRYNTEFAEAGINVNQIYEINPGHIAIRTYERGVENETLSCGTGVTAAAIAYEYRKLKQSRTPSSSNEPIQPITVTSLGGDLQVRFEFSDQGFSTIVLAGPAVPVFNGDL
jgi:diaminopimelate epimerase